MQQLISVDEAKQKFKSWRETKAPGDKIPSELWKVVGNILSNPDNKKSIATRALGISTAQLKQKFPQYFAAGDNQHLKISDNLQSAKFVQAPLTALISECTITIECANNMKLTITPPTTEQVTSLIKLFMEHNQCYR